MPSPSLAVLTDAMDEAARQTWFNLRESRDLSMRMGEETITEVNLLFLARALRSTGLPVTLVPTKANEDTTGVDFEIWVNGPRVFGYSIQAKVAKSTGRGFSYKHLGHQNSSKTAFQYELLEAHARKHRSRAVHVFYNGWDELQPGAPSVPSSVDHDLFGCAAAMTSVVRQIREASTNPLSGRSIAKVQPFLTSSMPWSNLFRLPAHRIPAADGGSGATESSAGGRGLPGESASGGRGRGPHDGPLRPIDLSSGGLEALEHEAESREVHGQSSSIDLEPRRPDSLPDYVVAARGRRREDLPRSPALPRYALVIGDDS